MFISNYIKLSVAIEFVQKECIIYHIVGVNCQEYTANKFSLLNEVNKLPAENHLSSDFVSDQSVSFEEWLR